MWAMMRAREALIQAVTHAAQLHVMPCTQDLVLPFILCFFYSCTATACGSVSPSQCTHVPTPDSSKALGPQEPKTQGCQERTQQTEAKHTYPAWHSQSCPT